MIEPCYMIAACPDLPVPIRWAAFAFLAANPLVHSPP